MSSHSHDLAALEKNIEAIHGIFKRFSEEHKAERLIGIIHNPGWTSIAEYALVAHALENALAQAEAAAKSYAALVEDAHKVGQRA
jgi:hypothetical protein